MRTWACTIGALLMAVLGTAPQASAALQPLELSIDGGEQSWHAENIFTVRWANPLGVAAVHYRVLDPDGDVAVAETTLGWPTGTIQHLAVPPTPGAYTVEVWLEDALGAQGTPVSAQLRFDDSAPGQVEPEPVDGWIGRTSFPLALRLGHPGGPEPLAGIRGYAVSIDGAPCDGALLCSEAETDLRGGAAADTLTLVDLPEGISHLNALAVSGSGMRSPIPGSTVLRVDKTDPLTRLSVVPDGWSRRPVTLIAMATDAAAGMVADGEGPVPYTALRIDGGAPAIAVGDTVTATVIGSGVHRIAHYARDAAGNVADGGHLNGRQSSPLVRIDREPPSLAFASAQDPGDPERIEARASDSLSGLDRSRGSIAVRRAGSNERFEQLPSQISGQLLQARWDSDGHPPGEYEFRAIAYDLAGNSTATTSRGGGAPMRLRSPLKVATQLIVDRGQRLVPFGHGSSFSGRLIAGPRAPLADMPVQVIERFGWGQRTTTVRSGSDGGFTLRLPPGPSREVLAVTEPTATLSGARSRPLRMSVRSGVRLRVSSPVARVGGRPVAFSGRVAGGAMPAEGKVVELQFRLPGLAWSEFRTIRTDSRGSFRYRYRFADDDSRGVRFQFRAYTPAQAGWPYEPAGSAPVPVRGV